MSAYVHNLSINLQFWLGAQTCMLVLTLRQTYMFIDWSLNICSNCSCRTYLRRKSWKLLPCCLHAFPNKRRSCKVLWEPFLLGSSQKACFALLSCMAWHVNTDTLFILLFLPAFFWINLTSDFHVGLSFAVYIQGLINVDYEAEVEDDILPIFRKGEVRSDVLLTLWQMLCQGFKFWFPCSYLSIAQC